MTIQYDNLNSTISAVGSATNIPVNIQTKGTGGLNLLGSGTNLFIYSQDFTNASWGKTNLTVTTGFVAPDNTSTANKLVENNVTGQHLIAQFQNAPSGITYTYSVYAKAAEWTSFQIQLGVGGPLATFNLSAVTASQTGGVSASIIAVGNGWFRCSLVGVSNGNGTCYIYKNSTSYAGNNIDGMFVWGAQLEIGSVTNAYIPTTAAAVYGTPTLTFSGVAGLGLQSDGSLYVQPAGVGALQAQPTTGTAAGGNARGANAVDLSTTRGAATQVASSAYSVISGGQANTASGFGTSVVGGVGNLSTGGYSFVGGGLETSARLGFSTAVGGFRNNAAGQYGFIGGGYSNLTTSNTAVTTQAAATNGVTSGSTAVTLAASNASIRVGQVIFGTGILGYPNDTYVAAISGTSLTLSQAASATGTPTLSFFTPHGVVVGGGNNQATGSYSFIGGGGDAGTAANRNVASGDWSFVGGGSRNTASAIYATVAGGANSVASGQGAFVGGGGWFGSGVSTNTASGTSSFIGAGYGNTASGFCASVVGGSGNTANQNFNSVLGGANGIGRSISGYTALPSSSNPLNSVQGSSQTGLLVLARQTTDATATALASDTSAASTTNQVILPNNSAYFFTGEVVSGVTGGGNTKGWTIEGVIKRGANAASTTLVGVTVTSMYADVGAATWTIAVTADTTNGGLAVTFTGQASTTIRTVAQIRTTEMTY